ncbi:aspartate-semialdehyde dehydrogenase, partial [mine drainage metagenome]
MGSDRSAGRRLEELWQLPEEVPGALARQRLRSFTPRELRARGVRVVFGALPSGTAGVLESECRRRGLHVFSNSSDHRMDPDVPLLVPEVNAAHLRALTARRRPGGILVTNPNCTAAGLVLGLAPIWKLLAPREVHLASYQALSGAGLPGVASLSITDNVVPFIREEEEKVAEETRRMLGTARNGRIHPRDEPVLAQCARVGVRDGHLEAITVVARRRPSRSEILDAWRHFDPLAGAPLPTLPHRRSCCGASPTGLSPFATAGPGTRIALEGWRSPSAECGGKRRTSGSTCSSTMRSEEGRAVRSRMRSSRTPTDSSPSSGDGPHELAPA